MKKQHKIKVKITFIFFTLLVAFVGLSVKIYYLKDVHGEEYENAARTQQVNRYDSIIPPIRGGVVDRNKKPLAISISVYNIILDPIVLAEASEEEQSKTVMALSSALNIDSQELSGYLVKDPITGKPALYTHWKILAKKQPRELKEELEEQNLKGVVYQKDTQRIYPLDTVAAHVLGFMRDTKWGIESQYDKEMQGVSGRSFITYEGSSGVVSMEMSAQGGNTIVTTLDFNIQQYAEQVVKEAMDEYNPENASAIVMDPNTGEIFAMASGLTFNANMPAEPLALSDTEFASKWEVYSSEEKVEYLTQTWKNFNVSSTFEPGSIFKPFVVAAALEENLISKTSVYNCIGYKEVVGEIIKCHLTTGHGRIDLEHVLANSCNVGMMDIADKMGANLFYQYQRDFGFGSYTGIDLPGEESANSLMYTPERIRSTELATMSFGQSFNCTTLQAVNSFATLINGGNLMKPYIVSQVIDTDGNIISETKPEVIRKVISQDTSDTIRTFLKTTMIDGTGTRAQIAGYSIGGKTGTAQQGVRADNLHTVSFISYFPVENPQYLIICVIHIPEYYQDGVTTASTMVKTLMEKIIKYKNLEPTVLTSEETITSSPDKVTLGEYKDEELFNVIYELDSKGINYEVVGSGNTVIGQAPHVGTEVEKGTKIILYVTKSEEDEGTVVMPDVYGLSYDDALERLMSQGFEVVIEGDDTGKVVSQSPKYGVSVTEGSEVTITFSKVFDE